MTMTDEVPGTAVHGTAIELHTGPLSPAEAKQAMEIYQEISSALIDESEDLQTINTRQGPRTFPKRSAFQKLANAYRVSTQIISRELTHDDDGRLVRCDAVVRATHPDGRYSEGDGTCSRTEERFARNADKLDHDLPATAVTRATNRAISNLVAFGAVSAEEINEPGVASAPAQAAELPNWAHGISNEAVGRFAEQLVDILTALGEENAATKVGAIGQAIFDHCGEDVPEAVSYAVGIVHAYIDIDTDTHR